MKDSISDNRIWSEVIDLLPVWTWETDGDYRLTYINLQGLVVPGLRTDDFIGLSILEGYQQYTNEPGLGTYMKALRDKKTIQNLCYERVLVNNERAVLMDTAVPRYGENGQFMGYRGVSFNLTETLKNAEDKDSLVGALQNRNRALEEQLSRRNEEIKASNHLLRGILDAMGEGVLVTSGDDISDPDNKVVLFNPAYSELFDLEDGEISVGMSMPEFSARLRHTNKVDTEELTEKGVKSGLQSGRKIMLSVPNLGKYYYVKSSPVPSHGLVLVHSDVTELQERNKALESARDASEAANKTKSAFLATMSHEIRTPMNGVVGMAELLADTQLYTEQEEYVDTIRDAGLALTRLISDILDFSKIEAGHLDLNPAPFALREMVAQTLDLLRPLASGKGLDIRFEISPEVPDIVDLDALRIRQILLNLLGNSVKFTLEGHIALCIDLCPDLRIRVRDTGIGMAQEHLPNVFSAFEQVHNGKERSFEGTGLGMAITKQLVNAMGGQIGVRSQLGVGSEFEITLPYTEGTIPLPTRTKSAPDPSILAGCHVLLVEDNSTNQLVVRKMLERRGVRVSVANNGRAALNLFQPNKYDLVFMDISMPIMTGLEASRHIRSREHSNGWPRVPIIALTGNAFEKDKSDAMSAGMDDFLTKPIQRELLLGCIQNYVANSQSA